MKIVLNKYALHYISSFFVLNSQRTIALEQKMFLSLLKTIWEKHMQIYHFKLNRWYVDMIEKSNTVSKIVNYWNSEFSL